MNGKRKLPWLGVVVAAIFLSAACKTYEPPPASISGVIHTDFSGDNTDSLLANANGFVYLDNDPDPSNGYSQAVALAVPFTLLSATEGVSYYFDEVPAGTYYLYAVLDTNGDESLSMTNSSGDAYGYYGDNTAQDFNVYVPAAANLAVDSEGYRTCDFWVGVPSRWVP